MILRHTPGLRRPGLSLMEVLVALAIFLLSFAVLSQLITLASTRAHDVALRTRAAQLCQSKMNEVTSGIVPLSSVGDTPFDEDGDWQWSLDAEQSNDVTGLWTVTVKVSRTNSSEGPQVDTELWGMLLDPTQRGSALDTVTVTSSATSSSSDSSSSSTDPSSSSTTPSATTTPSAAPAAAAAPAAGAAPGGAGNKAGGAGGTAMPSGGASGAPAGTGGGGKPAGSGSSTTGTKPGG